MSTVRTNNYEESLIDISVAMIPSESTCDLLSIGGAVRVVGSNFGVSDVNA